MAFIDDDDEEEEDILRPQSAFNYYFEDDNEEPVSFARLPIQWSDKEKVDGSSCGEALVYLRGTSDNGGLTLHKLVKAWQFDLRNFRPEISILTKDGIWIKLEKPRKSYEELIRTVLVTVDTLHYLRRNPQASDKSLWEHLSKRAYDVKPSQNDLVDHVDLIAEAAKRDVKNLAKSKFILAFLAKKPTKKRLPDEDKPKDDFIVEDDLTVASDENDSDDDDDEDFFESTCAICDDGGNLLCCDGSCLRSFHPTKEDGIGTHCKSLGLTKKEVQETQKFFCENCKRQIHSCFICKKLGSSDNSAGTAEVFQCVSATCGYFYHPRCVTTRLSIENNEEAEAMEKQIIAGEFTCTLHKCSVCGKGEVKTDHDLQFAVCRRCPKSYHRKCLPKGISFEDIEDEDIIQRAWDGILKNRILIYCLEHEIDEELETPVRDHVKFFPSKDKVFTTEKRKKLESHAERDNVRPKLGSRDSCGKASVKPFRSSFPSSKHDVSTKKHGSVSSIPDHLRRPKVVDPARKSNFVPNKSQKMMGYGESSEAVKKKMEVNKAKEAGKPKLGVKEAHTAEKSKVSLGERLFNYMQEPNTLKPGQPVSVDSKHNKADSTVSKEARDEISTLDNDSQRRLMAIMKSAKEEITMDDILKKYKVSSKHTNTMDIVNKTITMGKVVGSVQAIRTALKKYEEGGRIEDAKAVCEPEVLNQVFKWKEKLKLYLNPFLHGARYTSFGRHFTNVDKLQQIVERLHWYAEDDDMIVDFCCGSNDFSCLMKSKLEETGKKCLYKNYDLIQAKNAFNFERRDWMTVSKEELPPGHKLIMGLNPPFGVNASQANKFIAKALEFRPKILILIVPRETERLDKKKGSSYVLTWEDESFLSGKSFYLPGSVNDEEKQLEDWNITAPLLSLWSRSDFADMHKEIAEKHYHLSTDVGSSKFKKVEEVNTSLNSLGVSDGVRDANSTLRDGAFENDETSRFEDEDVPMEIDETEVSDCVQNILLSEKIEARETTRRSLEKENKTNHYSASLGKSKADSSNEDLKSSDMEEERVELNRGPKSMTSNWESPVRSSSDDIYAVCTSISNATTPQRSHESVEAVSLPVITRTKSNLGKDIKKPDGGKVRGVEKPEELRNRPTSSVRSTRDDVYTARPSPSNAGQKPYESLSHFDDGLAEKYGFGGGGYRIPDPPLLDQFPLAASVRSEMFDYRGGYSDLNRGISPTGYDGGHLDPILAPPPMDNAFPMQQRYAPHFDGMNYQRMSSFPPQPPMHQQSSGHNLYDPTEFPLRPPPRPSGDLGRVPMGFAPGPNYSYMGRSGGWLND